MTDNIESTEFIRKPSVKNEIGYRDLKIVREEPLSKGGHEEKFLLTLEDGSRAIRKIVDPKVTNPEDYVGHWQAFKDAGILVVPWMYASGNSVISPYMEGAVFYGKQTLQDLGMIKNRSKESPELLRRYKYFARPEDVHLLSLDCEGLETRLKDVAKKATETQRELPYDDPIELCIVRKGTKFLVDFMILDMSRVSRIFNEPRLLDTNTDLTLGVVSTLQSVQGFIMELG